MSIVKVLNSLERSWNREDILKKIKNILGTDEIVTEFLEKKTNCKLKNYVPC